MSDPKSPLIVRGGEAIPQDELVAHLAIALRLENVGVLLGAGSSVSVGGKTFAGTWSSLQSMHAAEVSQLAEAGFLGKSDETMPDIERLLGDLAIAALDAARRNAGDERTTIARLRRVVAQHVVAAATLKADLWVSRERRVSGAELEAHRRLLARLQGSRQPGQAAPWVFTTNYDLAVDWAAEALQIHVVNGFTGLHSRRFQPNAFDLSLQNTAASGEARFGTYNVNFAKLHGSLNWRASDDGEALELPSDQVREDILRYAAGDDAVDLSSSLLIYPTAAKYMDTVGYVYGELIRRFTEFMARPNTALIVCGYGFNDRHINRLLASGLLNPTLQLVVYHPEWTDAGQAPGNRFVAHLRSLGLPRVIIKGGGADAHFEQMTSDLPDPAMADEVSPEVRRALAALARGIPVSAGPAKQNG